MTIQKVTATAALGCLLLGAAVAPASAAGLKLYAENDYKGLFATYTTTGARTISPNWNDTLSSFNNETQFDAALYHDANQKGSCFTAKRRSKAAWFAAWDDNKVSSLRVGAVC